MATDSPSLSIDADILKVRTIASFVRERCGWAGVSDTATDDLELAVVEAANNIVFHGYPQSRGPIKVSIHAQRGVVEVTLTDFGEPIPSYRLSHQDPNQHFAENGRGLAIIRACVDRLEYRSKNGVNRLTLVKAG